jgi:phosphoglycolate phosphatase
VKRFSNVLVDLDGTVTDPFEGIAGCIRHAMRSMELAVPQDDELRGAIGPPLRQSFARLLARHGAEGRVEEAMRSYRERFSAVGLLENRVYLGVPEMLGELNAAGCRLFIATSKPTVFARRIVDHFGLSGYFADVYGSELNGRLENKGDLIRFVLEEEGIAAVDAAMIGDRSHDVVGAKANGVSAVGVLWGYGSREELDGADVRCDSPAEVVRFFAGQAGEGAGEVRALDQ